MMSTPIVSSSSAISIFSHVIVAPGIAPVAQRRVEYDDAVLLGLAGGHFGLLLSCALTLVSDERPYGTEGLKIPDAQRMRPTGPQG